MIFSDSYSQQRASIQRNMESFWSCAQGSNHGNWCHVESNGTLQSLFVDGRLMLPFADNSPRNWSKTCLIWIWSWYLNLVFQIWSKLRHTHILRNMFTMTSCDCPLLTCFAIFRILWCKWVWLPTFYRHAIPGEWKCSRLCSRSPWLWSTASSMTSLLDTSLVFSDW